MKKLAALLALLLCSAFTFAQGVTVVQNLDEATTWITCGNCGNSGGTGATANYWLTQNTTISRDGVAGQFNIDPLGHAYANGYFDNKSFAPTLDTNVVYEFDILIPVQYLNAPQAIEFECQQTIAGVVYNYAWQALFTGTKTWRAFNYATRIWENTGIPVNPAALADGNWHHVKAVYARDAVLKKTKHVSLTVDGVVHSVGIVHPSVQKYSLTSNTFSAALQLDTTSKAVPYYVLVDKMTVTHF